jgi:hypothetical protein
MEKHKMEWPLLNGIKLQWEIEVDKEKHKIYFNGKEFKFDEFFAKVNELSTYNL